MTRFGWRQPQNTSFIMHTVLINYFFRAPHSWVNHYTVAQLVEHRAAMRDVSSWLQPHQHVWGLEITYRRMRCFCNYIRKRLDIKSSWIRTINAPVSQPITVHTTPWDVKLRTHTLFVKSNASSSRCSSQARVHSEFILVQGEIANGLIAAASGACMVMSDLTHRSIACKTQLNM